MVGEGNTTSFPFNFVIWSANMILAIISIIFFLMGIGILLLDKNRVNMIRNLKEKFESFVENLSKEGKELSMVDRVCILEDIYFRKSNEWKYGVLLAEYAGSTLHVAYNRGDKEPGHIFFNVNENIEDLNYHDYLIALLYIRHRGQPEGAHTEGAKKYIDAYREHSNTSSTQVMTD